jgi:16S rRNA (uracil1498-N3)-methyltransferase
MREWRCFHDDALVPGSRVLLAREEATHLTRVLRARAGDRVVVLDGRGRRAEAVVADAKSGALELGAVTEFPPPLPALELALALTRTEAFEEALARAIELGISGFRPIACEHAMVRLDAARRAARLDRWRRLAIERLKQCERLWLPALHEPVPVAEALEAAVTAGLTGVALLERAACPGLAEVLAGLEPDAPVCLFIGPEGGWAVEERQALESACRPASLGSAVLRSETAALAAVALAACARVRPATDLCLPNSP